MRFTLIIALITLFISSSDAITVVDGRGKTITLKKTPLRIISTTPSNTELLFALGLEKRIVGVTTYCDYPPNAKLIKDKIGDMTTSVEKVVALKPDLVVAHSLLNAKAVERLEKLKIPVFAGDPKDLKELMAFIIQLGKATDKQLQATKMVTDMKARIEAVKSLAKKQKVQPKALFIIQFSPLWVAGKDTFIDELCAIAGCVNSAKSQKGFYQTSVEGMIAANPDVIFVLHPDSKQYSKNQTWKMTNAVKKNRVYSVNADIFSRVGPRLVNALELIYRYSH